MSGTLAANQHATFDEYDRTMGEHNRDASGILNQIVGASSGDDMDADLKARMWDHYVGIVREWDARRPEWVR